MGETWSRGGGALYHLCNFSINQEVVLNKNVFLKYSTVLRRSPERKDQKRKSKPKREEEGRGEKRGRNGEDLRSCFKVPMPPDTSRAPHR